MTWISADTYCARIGGIVYKNVQHPIKINGEDVFQLTRDQVSNQLAVSFVLHRENGAHVAAVTNSIIGKFDESVYILLQGTGRSALVERKTGRVWCEISIPPLDAAFELDVSAIVITPNGYPIFLHPDRSKFGKANDNQGPNIARLTLSTNRESHARAIALKSSPLYLLSMTIENFDVGISVLLNE